MFRNTCRGFTLVELMLVIAVLAVTLTLGFPSFQGAMRSSRIATATNELMASMNLARSTAIRSGSWVSVCPSQDGVNCLADADWSQGWLVFTDRQGAGDGAIGEGDAVQRHTQARSQVQMAASNAAVVTFDAHGRRKATTDPVIVLQPSDGCSGVALRRTLTVSATGTSRITREECQ